MAISHIQPFLLLLLVSLFFLPALVRGVEYRNCSSYLPVKVTSVEISPDSYNLVNRTGTFTIKANSTTVIPRDSKVILTQTWRHISLDNPTLVTYKKEYSICNVTTCPVKPGPLTLTLTNTFSASPKTKPKGVQENIRIEIRTNVLLPLDIMCIRFRIRPKTS